MADGLSSPDYFQLTMGLAGGLALFLFGMETMADALKAVAGDRMKAILAKLTANRFMGVATGTFVTAVIQSSSVTTVLLVGFISAGLMTLSQSIGVILGAGIGTTITAQVIAFKVTKYALLIIAVGFAVAFLGPREKVKLYGTAVLGLGLIFFGMAVMGETMSPLRSYPPFLDWMGRMDDPLLGIAAGTVFTAVVQSSSATTGVVIVMASQGLISLDAGIALIFGANIGTCVTALLASIGRTREAVRAAVVHVIFKIVGVLIWLAFIPELAELVTWMSPSHAELAGTDRLAAETPRQIANAHTAFNVINCLLFLPLTNQFARFVEWLVPDRPEEEAEETAVRHLEDDLLRTPALALNAARKEILHMGEGVTAMFERVLPAMLVGTEEDLAAVVAMDDVADSLHGQIVTYLGRVSKQKLSDRQTDELVRLLGAVNDLESIGDLIDARLAELGRSRLEKGVVVSDATVEVIGQLHAAVDFALETALVAVAYEDAESSRAVVAMKDDIGRMLDRALLHVQKRLVADEPNRLAAYRIEVDMLENLRGVFHFCRRMARVAAP